MVTQRKECFCVFCLQIGTQRKWKEKNARVSKIRLLWHLFDVITWANRIIQLLDLSSTGKNGVPPIYFIWMQHHPKLHFVFSGMGKPCRRNESNNWRNTVDSFVMAMCSFFRRFFYHNLKDRNAHRNAHHNMRVPTIRASQPKNGNLETNNIVIKKINNRKYIT